MSPSVAIQMGEKRSHDDKGSSVFFCVYKEFCVYTEQLYKKDLQDPDNHDGVITHLEPDILECEVKWALGSITMNKASGGDGIPVEYFKSQKMML